MTATEMGAILVIAIVFFIYILVIFGPPVDRLLRRLQDWFRRKVY